MGLLLEAVEAALESHRGFGMLPTILANHMAKRVEDELESGTIYTPPN